MKCNECESCNAKCIDYKNGCHKCGKKGMEVEYDTVFNLTNDYIKHTLAPDDHYFLCTTSFCENAYYTLEGRNIALTDINTDIWFKKQRKKFLVCYCRDISLDDIVLAVNNLEDVSIPKVVHFLQKDDIETDCIHKNPTSKSCDKLFENAIEYAKKIKNIKSN